MTAAATRCDWLSPLAFKRSWNGCALDPNLPAHSPTIGTVTQRPENLSKRPVAKTLGGSCCPTAQGQKDEMKSSVDRFRSYAIAAQPAQQDGRTYHACSP